MIPSDKDLVAKILSLPERSRQEFLQFFGVSGLSMAEIADLQNNLLASLALKNRVSAARGN